jgi:hypothetical protein
MAPYRYYKYLGACAAKDDEVEKGVGSQPIGSVHGGGCGLSSCVQALQYSSPGSLESHQRNGLFIKDVFFKGYITLKHSMVLPVLNARDLFLKNTAISALASIKWPIQQRQVVVLVPVPVERLGCLKTTHPDSVVDPDPAGSEICSRIQILPK